MAIFDPIHATAYDVLSGLANGRLTSQVVVEAYLLRIRQMNERLCVVTEINLTVLSEASERAKERSQGRIRGILH